MAMKLIYGVIFLGSCFAVDTEPRLDVAGFPNNTHGAGDLASSSPGHPFHVFEDAGTRSWALSYCNGWSTCPSMRQYALLLSKADPPVDSPPFDTFPETPMHKDLFPLSSRDLISWIIASVALFIAAGGGIGGGGILVPLYIIGLRFATEHAVALSNITIFGGSFANLVCNLKRTHPTAARPLIDWDLILAMEPATIVGAVFGGYLNKLLPVWLTTVMLFGLLLVMSHKLWIKAKSAFDRETNRLMPSLSDLNASFAGNGAFEPLLADSGHHTNEGLIERMVCASANNPMEPVYRDATQILVAESRQVPVWKICTLISLFAWLLTTDSWKNGIACGGALYWLLVLSIVPVVVVFTLVCRRYLLWKAAVKDAVGLTPEVGDIKWCPDTTIKYPLVCSMAGLIAGMFGVGGGIIKGPLMLALGVLPEVAAATSATMIFFTAGSASIVYLSFGGVKWDYGVVLMMTGFAVTFAGQMFTYYIIEALGRRSIIIIAMALLLTMGCSVMAYESVAAFAEAMKEGFFQVSSVCH